MGSLENGESALRYDDGLVSLLNILEIEDSLELIQSVLLITGTSQLPYASLTTLGG